MPIFKKITLSTLLLVSASALMAGGYIAPVEEEVIAPPPPAPIVCNGSRTYTEFTPKLMWQDSKWTDAEMLAAKEGTNVGKTGSLFYADSFCKNSNFAGYNDWRLPTSDELQHVLSRPGETDVFQYHASDLGGGSPYYWTSSAAGDDEYYTIYPKEAYKYKASPKESHYIRCVRCLTN